MVKKSPLGEEKNLGGLCHSLLMDPDHNQQQHPTVHSGGVELAGGGSVAVAVGDMGHMTPDMCHMTCDT